MLTCSCYTITICDTLIQNFWDPTIFQLFYGKVRFLRQFLPISHLRYFDWQYFVNAKEVEIPLLKTGVRWYLSCCCVMTNECRGKFENIQYKIFISVW